MNEYALTEWTVPNVLLRVFCALLFGSIIGLDRGSKRRVAGIKTNSIVCLGSALVMLTSQFMSVYFPGEIDLSRMAAQVISGVGFLGVGTIIVTGNQVRGLTTAASLWTCACIGLAVGIGYISGAALITGCMLLSFHFLPKIEKFVYRRSPYLCLFVELDSIKNVSGFIDYMHAHHIVIDSLDIVSEKKKEKPVLIQTVLKLPKTRDRSFSWLDSFHTIQGVQSIEVM